MADQPRRLSLALMQGLVVALLVAAAAFAPSAARPDPGADLRPDSLAEGVATSVQDPGVGSRRAATDEAATPVPTAAAGRAKVTASHDPSRTLPPTDTVSPAVDSRD